MLQDWLAKDYDWLELTEADRKSVRSAQNGKALQAVGKLCVARMEEIQSGLLNSPAVFSDAQGEGALQAWRAYNTVIQFILDPQDSDEEDENE